MTFGKYFEFIYRSNIISISVSNTRKASKNRALKGSIHKVGWRYEQTVHRERILVALKHRKIHSILLMIK